MRLRGSKWLCKVLQASLCNTVVCCVWYVHTVVVQVLLELITEKCTVAEDMLKQLPPGDCSSTAY